MVRMFIVVIMILARLAAIAADRDVVEIREAIDENRYHEYKTAKIGGFYAG